MTEYIYDNILEIAGTLVGVLYLYWEYKGDIKLWIAGIIMPAISLYVYYNAGLYADFGINIYYFLASIYGLAIWLFGMKGDKGDRFELKVAHTSRKLYLPLSLAFLVLWIVIGEILIHFTNSTVPWIDSFTTALSIIGMWMLARKLIEQWWAWLLVDVVSSCLYVYKGVYFYAALYAAYSVIVFFGYKKWKMLMAQGL